MMKKVLTAVVAAFMAIAGWSFALPKVSGYSTSPGVWTSNITGVREASATTGYPILVMVINDHSDTPSEGCSHCWAMLERNYSYIEAMTAKYKFYKVLLNYMAGAEGYSNLAATYRKDFGSYGILPSCYILKPGRSGGVDSGWGYPTTEHTNSGVPVLAGHIESVLKKYQVCNSSFALASTTAATVTMGAQWKGKITRAGGSGKDGTSTLKLSGTNVGYYTVTPATIEWGTGDGTKEITVSATPTALSPALVDNLKLTITSATAGATVTGGTLTQDITFKSASIGKTLGEVSSGTAGFANLSSTDFWYGPTSGEAKLVAPSIAAKGKSVLTWTADKGGIATLVPWVSSPNVQAEIYATIGSQKVLLLGTAMQQQATAVLPANNQNFSVSTGTQGVTIGVKAGDKITISVEADAAIGAGVAGLKQMTFKELQVKLTAPANKAVLSWPDVCANHALVDLAWSANLSDCEYELFGTHDGIAKVFTGSPLLSGGDTKANAFDVGLVKATDQSMGSCQWGVRATNRSASYGVAVATATAEFTASAQPQFVDMPKTVGTYLKAKTVLDFSAEVPAGTDAVTYSATGLPKGLSIDKNTGKISGTVSSSLSKTITVTAKNKYGSSSTTFVLNAQKITTLKGKFNGLLFDAAGKRIVGSLTYSIAANAKWTGKLVIGSQSTKISGLMKVDEVGPTLTSDNGLTLALVPGTKMWKGVYRGGKVFASKTVSASSALEGFWNAAASCSIKPNVGGYIRAKVAAGGKATLSGTVSAKIKIAGSGQLLTLDARTLQNELPEWAGNGGAASLFYVYKKAPGKSFDGGLAFYADGSVRGNFMSNGIRFDQIEGSKWDPKQSLVRLEGATVTSENVTFGVKGGEKKATAAANDVSGKFSAKSATGVFKGSFKSGKIAKFEGILYISGGAIVGGGGGAYTSNGNTIAVTVK